MPYLWRHKYRPQEVKMTIRIINKLPQQQDRIKARRSLSPTPTSKFDFTFPPVDMTGMFPLLQGLVENRKLIEYEDFQYVDENGVMRDNITARPYVYDIVDGVPEFRRKNRMYRTPKGLVTFTIWNPKMGYFPEVAEQFPDIPKICNDFVAHSGIEFSRISLVYVDSYLPYHVDSDFDYGIRLNISHGSYKFGFKEILGDKDKFVRDSLTPPDNYDDYLKIVDGFPDVGTLDQEQTGLAYSIDSYNYMHDFTATTSEPAWLIAFNVTGLPE
jgi:hypothetical protein